MTESSFPWVGGGAVDAGGWRGLHAGMWADGVTHDTDYTAFAPTVTGSDKVVTVAAGTAHVQGAGYESDAAVNHNIGATGSAPTSGQYRWDYIVLRYDPSQPVADRVKQAIRVGTPSTTPAFPTLTQNPAGVWEMVLVTIKRGPGNVDVTSAMVAKASPLAAAVVSVSATADLPLGLPGGGLAHTRNNLYRRVSSGDYQSILDPDWTDLAYATGVAASGPALGWRFERGGIKICGTFQKSSGTFTAGVWAPVANIPSGWAELFTTEAFIPAYEPMFPVTLTNDYATGSPAPAAAADVHYKFTTSGGVMYVRPSGTVTGRRAWVDHFLGRGNDPRLA